MTPPRSPSKTRASAQASAQASVQVSPTAAASANKRSAHAAPLPGFQYARGQFEELADLALTHAKKLGATDGGVEVSEGAGLSVSVRKGALENVERNRDKSLGITVYLGQRRGNASTSDFSPAAIRQTVQAAYDIARFTAEDPVAGLPDEQDVANDGPDLDLFHPWPILAEQAMDIALRCEAAAMAMSKKITNSEGAGVSAQQSHFFSEHMRAGERGRAGIFRGGYASSRHSFSVAPIAGKGAHMQRDYWYSSMRSPDDLASPEAVGRYAAERALSRLNARKVATTQCPVLFESPLAAGLLGAFVQAVSGGALYRKTSFLVDSLGRQVFPKHIDIQEDPFILRGKGSSPFDDEGVKTVPRTVVSAGCVKGYFLSTYSARKLGMRTTGNSGGSHNLLLTSRLTRPEDDLDAMLRKLGTGLFVTELMGQGVNYVTGDYSRGAAGFWVENGQIAFPVQEVTIAGNLKDMLKAIAAVGADVYGFGAKNVGSILIERMKVAGS
jgi:PmbA protein